MFDTANPPQARIAPADSKPRTRFSLKTKTQRHADAAPLPVSSVATTGVRSSARPAQRMGDVCRQVSWLAAQTLLPAFPKDPMRTVQWHMWQQLAAYSCGGSSGIARCRAHRIPIFTVLCCHSPKPSQCERTRSGSPRQAACIAVWRKSPASSVLKRQDRAASARLR